MALPDVWRAAVEAIADGNRAQKPCGIAADGKSLQDALKRHTGENLARLRDCVTYLIWAELTRRCRVAEGQDPDDRFLGYGDLREYLQDRVPQRYDQADVDGFLASLGPDIWAGDLRTFLVQHGCRHDELDDHLLEEDFNLLRWELPGHVTAGLTAQALRRTRRRLQKMPNDELRPMVGRKMPLSIEGWASIIAGQLATGTCNCAESFNHTPHASGAAQTRCQGYHFLSRENLDAGLEGRLPQQKKPFKDALDFVERAVVFKLRLVYRKHHADKTTCDFKAFSDFAKSMLCNEFTAPGGAKLRLKQWENTTVLTIDRITTLDLTAESSEQNA